MRTQDQNANPAVTESQRKALEALLSGENVFLTGKAGTGKSFVLRRFVEAARERGKRVARLAPTGLAAINIGGETLHRFFRVGAPVNGDQALRNLLRRRAAVRENLEEVDVIVIDEISMVNGWLLAALEAGARKCLGNNQPWGGKQVVVIGDFLQLPPVPSNRDQASPWQWAFHSSAWSASRFRVKLLTEPMRQTEPQFLDALEEARAGRFGEALAKLVRDRLNAKPAGTPIHLFATRRETDEYNSRKFDELKTEPVMEFRTNYSFRPGDDVEFVEKDEFPIPPVLRLRPGAEIIFRNNDPGERWINGTRGRVLGFPRVGEEQCVQVEIDGESVVVGRWIFKIANHRNETLATAENFPFHLAWGLTIHKSQGMSLDQAVIDLSRVFAPGQAYVALSRIRRTQGVFLRGTEAAVGNSFTADADALKFMTSLVPDGVSNAPVPPPRRARTCLEPEATYSKEDIEDILGTEIPADNFRALIVTNANNRVILVKGRQDMNPNLCKGELWVAWDKNPRIMDARRQQLNAIANLDHEVPLFSRVPGNQGRVWRFEGLFGPGSVTYDKQLFPDAAKQPPFNVYAVVRLTRAF